MATNVAQALQQLTDLANNLDVLYRATTEQLEDFGIFAQELLTNIELIQAERNEEEDDDEEDDDEDI